MLDSGKIMGSWIN